MIHNAFSHRTDRHGHPGAGNPSHLRQTFNVMSWLIRHLPGTEMGYTLFNLSSHGIAMVIMLPAAFCAGMTLPLITTTLLRTGAGERSIGAVYGFNTDRLHHRRLSCHPPGNAPARAQRHDHPRRRDRYCCSGSDSVVDLARPGASPLLIPSWDCAAAFPLDILAEARSQQNGVRSLPLRIVGRPD